MSSDALQARNVVVTPQELLARAIEETENRIYEDVARIVFFGSNMTEGIHRGGYCHIWTPAAEKHIKAELGMFDQSARVTPMQWQPMNAALPGDFHQFVQISFHGLEEPVIVDGTWQQFLPETDLERVHPRLLVGTADEVSAYAASLAVPHALHIWHDAHPLNYLGDN